MSTEPNNDALSPDPVPPAPAEPIPSDLDARPNPDSRPEHGLESAPLTVPLEPEGLSLETLPPTADPETAAKSTLPAGQPPPAAVTAAGGLQPVSEETQLLYELVGDAHLLTVVVLIGASALLPVPFLDDVAKAYLERRMLRTIAEGEKLTLAPEEIDRLTKEPPKGCCMLGCLGKAVIYPIKRIIRKILFFLEIKRAVDQSSTALAEAWLFALALRRGLWSSGRDIAESDRLREVIEASCQSQGVKPLETAFHHAFRGAKDTLMDFASRFVGKADDNKEQLDAAVKKLEIEEGERLANLSTSLKKALSEVGEVYLRRFAEQFEKQMEEARTRPPTP
jgi:hypothetical protein